MTQKIEAYGCWSNEQHIVVSNEDAGVIHSMLFNTKEAAQKYYKAGLYPKSLEEDPIVKITVEIMEDV